MFAEVSEVVVDEDDFKWYSYPNGDLNDIGFPGLNVFINKLCLS